MIAFFRKIRQKLFPIAIGTENRVSKYFLYAIGEILLVVIGILIALQIDNYNEDLKNREIYLSYLVRLNEDFLELQETVKQKMEWEGKLIELAEYQLRVMTGEEPDPELLKLAMSIEYTASVNRYEIMSPTYMELNSTGRLELIESDSLKLYLSRYHKYLLNREDQKDEWDPWTHEYRSKVRNILHPEDRGFVDFQFGNETTDPDHPSWQMYILKSDRDKVVEALLEIPGLTGLLQDVLTARRITYTYLDYEFNVTHEFLRLIRSEIDRLQGDGRGPVTDRGLDRLN